MRIDQRVNLMQVLLAVHPVIVRIGAELPTLVAHDGLDDIHRNDVLEALQFAEDHGAMRPRAGERDVKMIAPARRRKAAFAARPGAAVRRHPVAELRLAALETPAGCLGVVKPGVPDAVDEFTMRHEFFPSSLPGRRAAPRPGNP